MTELPTPLHEPRLMHFIPNLKLYFEAMLLHLRSRRGFLLLLASFRPVILIPLLANLLFTERYKNPFVSLIWIGYALFAAYSWIEIFRNHTRADHDSFHIRSVLIDAAALSAFVFINGEADTDIYLFYLLPLITAAHFLPRKTALILTGGVAGVYLASLWGIQYIRGESLLLAFFWIWPSRVTFLLASLWLYRVQRSLPSPSETQIVSPAAARENLERLLFELQNSVDFHTASIQILVRDKLEIVVCAGFDPAVTEIVNLINFPIHDERFPNKKVVDTGHWVIADTGNYASFSDTLYQASEIRTWMGIPILHPATGELFGLLSIDSLQPNAYTRRDADLATQYARKAAAYMTDAALGPSALSLSTKRDALNSLIKKWVKGLPGPIVWTDDLDVARKITESCQQIFLVEDCSLYFMRRRATDASKVLYLVASSAIPSSEFTKNESPVSGRPGDGLTGYSVFKNKTLNYGYSEIESSPHHGTYIQHLDHLESKRCKQLMVTPIHNSYGEVIGALKIENKQGWPSQGRFPYAEQKLFEAYAQIVGLIIEEVRERNYIRRQRSSIHNLRSVLSKSVVKPLGELTLKASVLPDLPADLYQEIENIQKAVTFTTSTLDRFLMDTSENLILENEGLIPALQSFVSIMGRGFPNFTEVCHRINFQQTGLRDTLPFKVRVALYNIGREAIMNVIRHSKIERQDQGKAEVIFGMEDGMYFLLIEDNGEGFDEYTKFYNSTSFGFIDMDEQIQTIMDISLLAKVDISSTPCKGTKVKAVWKPGEAGR